MTVFLFIIAFGTVLFNAWLIESGDFTLKEAIGHIGVMLLCFLVGVLVAIGTATEELNKLKDFTAKQELLRYHPTNGKLQLLDREGNPVSYLADYEVVDD